MPFARPVLALALLTLLTATPSAAAADGWSVAPSGEGRPAFYAEGEPGSVLQDTVALTNRTRRPVDIALRAEGADVTFADASVRLPPRTRTEVPFTVTAPDADGTAEIVARDADGRTRRVDLHLRAAVPTVAALTVEHLAVHGDRITYELVNRGTTPLAPTVALRADGLFGRVLDRAPRTLPHPLAPGERRRLAEPWDRPALDSVEVRLTVTAAGGARDTASVTTGSGPWGAGVAGAAVAAGGALFVVRRRRRRETPAAESPCTEVELTGAVS
ncbi:LPXTG cell wall anchor domain-containing protein [Streptomyces sp. S.PB5]|uniref:COG1470 family protein n=1 Tax=Streptomyces sp. S.PB5 TaxID=3020844 RepID=UPI0025B0E791|nr:LPXTG cell wall anchor domain-containing protein [Streptomyces sp. S.PB5]MDN3023048.1 LPXTG cell wall anchor domain-containing protein [Streptomyces sp. S.PB5]